MNYLIGFEDEQALDARIVGQKFRSLARAYRAGFAVPRAVAISTEAHRYYLTNKSWPDGLAQQVLDAAYALKIYRGLSIRSSATREDLEKQSFAGQYRTFLKVVAQEDLNRSIEACWRSVSSEAVQSYLQAKNPTGHPTRTPLMAVVIQKMVNAVVSGVAFGRDPLQPAADKIIIEAVDGLAEDLVDGRCSPYRIVVAANGNVALTPPETSGSRADNIDPMLHIYSFWNEIAGLVRKLESDDGQKPLDIEWAVDVEKKIWLLQVRPITTLDEESLEIPAGLWTRKIANDLWADRLTPFLAGHMTAQAALFDLTRTLNILGIPFIRPTLAVIHGYLYINCENVKTGMAYLPPGLQLRELRHLLPPSVRSDDSAISPPVWKLANIALRSILLLLLEPGANPFICQWLAKRHQKKIHQRIDQITGMPTASPQETISCIQATMETLSRLQIYNQWPYFFATFTTWVLRWLTVNHMGLSHAQFLRQISQKANNITIDIERNFREKARSIASDSELADRFLYESPGYLVADLPEDIQIWLNKFLARYGCRSRHRTLLVKRWIESPEEIISILQSLVRNYRIAEVDGPPEKEPTSHGRSPKPENATGRLALRLTNHFARQFLDLREDLRFALDRVLHLLRQTLLTLGQQTDLGNLIFFLEACELEDLVHGDLSSAAAGRKARQRHDRFSKPFDVATYYNNGRAENEFDSDGTILEGIGTSPGRVQGHAKIVENPVSDDIESGHILVARNTDPGWTPVLSVVRGMVMEEGGLLNHCSIVARELGIPSVVGVRGATRKIRDNDLVTIDGGLGIVKIER